MINTIENIIGAVIHTIGTVDGGGSGIGFMAVGSTFTIA